MFEPNAPGKVCVRVCVRVCVVRTEGRLRGLGSLHTGTVVSHIVVGTGAHGPAGAQQTQPLTLLTVARVSHWYREKRERERERENNVK